QALSLVQQVEDTAPRSPDRVALAQLLHGSGLPSEWLTHGLEALGWLAEDRGLAGLADTDGLAWSLPMHELFECWVEHLVGRWAHGIGGQLTSGRKGQTGFPIHWRRPGTGSL